MSPDSDYYGGLKTELSLAQPGGDCSVPAAQAPRHPAKRDYQETFDLDLRSNAEDVASVVTLKSESKAQAVGWPPVRSYRKNTMKGSKFVKVAVDGAPYIRKIDLEIYTGYKELLAAFEDMFACLNICDLLNEKKITNFANGALYVPTYEDRDGDWMLVGDVPWKMFVDSCQRLRLMKSSEDIGLASKTTSSKGSNFDHR